MGGLGVKTFRRETELDDEQIHEILFCLTIVNREGYYGLHYG